MEKHHRNMVPVLRTARLEIRHLSDMGASTMTDYVTGNADHFAPTEPPCPKGYFTREYWQRAIYQSLAEFGQDNAVRFVLLDGQAQNGGEPGPAVGTVNLTGISRGPFQACNLGFGLCRKHEGQGLMFEALESVIDYAFGTLNLHRIMASHLPENRRSGDLLDRLGFEVDGTAGEYLFINGAWRDHVLRSRVNRDWREA